MSSQPVQLQARKPLKASERQKLIRRAKFLVWLGLGWHSLDAAISIVAGIIAGSIALIGFGTDSLLLSF